jgi:putative lipase involved disintegration of autophagic bodies
MPITPKRTDQKRHAKKRAEQRYGLNLNSKDYIKLCELAKKAIILVKQSLTRSIRKIIYKDIEYFVVYDKSRKQIATFLTKEMTEITVSRQG